MDISRRELSLKAAALGLGWPLLVGCARDPLDNEQSKEKAMDFRDSRGIDFRTRDLNCSLTSNGRFGTFGRLDVDELSIAMVDFEARSSVSYAIGSEFYEINDIVISADGSRIAFMVFARTPEVESEIWVMDLDGVVEARLIGLGRPKGRPSFSPDGSKLLFSADMRHQYLSSNARKGRDTIGLASMAVHQLDLKNGSFRLVDLPILPISRGNFFTDRDTIIGVWAQNVVDPEFSGLPVDAYFELGGNDGFGGNFWERNRPRLEQTIGEARLSTGGISKFQKFEMMMPPFESSRDSFRVNPSPCRNGFLATLSLWEPNGDPPAESLRTRSYREVGVPKVGLSWLTRDGERNDVILPSEVRDLPFVCGSYDKRRIIAWGGLAKKSAAELRYPRTYTTDGGWEFIDLGASYKSVQKIDVKLQQSTVTIEIPKLIDKNGVGKTFETIFENHGARK